MVELVCHLRDTEREVHSQQIDDTARIAGAVRGTAGRRRVGKAAAISG